MKNLSVTKNVLFALIAALLLEILLGAFLSSNFSLSLKSIHGTIGLIIAALSIAYLFFALREAVSLTTKALAFGIAVFVLIAFTGGKLAASQYELGMLLMRGSAVIALGLSIVSVFSSKSSHKVQ